MKVTPPPTERVFKPPTVANVLASHKTQMNAGKCAPLYICYAFLIFRMRGRRRALGNSYRSNYTSGGPLRGGSRL